MRFKVKLIDDEKIVLERVEGKSEIEVSFELYTVTLDGVEDAGEDVEVFVDKASANSYGRGQYEYESAGLPSLAPIRHNMRLPDKRGRLKDEGPFGNLRDPDRSHRVMRQVDIGSFIGDQRFVENEEIEIVVKRVDQSPKQVCAVKGDILGTGDQNSAPPGAV